MSWGRELSDFETRLTSSDGVAIATFSVKGIPSSTHLLLTGIDVPADREVTQMFIESLRKVHLVQLMAQSEAPFADVATLAQRPLQVVVPWGPPGIPIDLDGMAQELSAHFVGAYFLRVLPTG